MIHGQEAMSSRKKPFYFEVKIIDMKQEESKKTNIVIGLVEKKSFEQNEIKQLPGE